jgi:pyruvate formate lyase activating enzyme
MEICTTIPEDLPALRIIHGPSPHSVGGKATPWWLKSSGRYIEVAIWTAGCNLRCPQCQNFTTTYDGRSAAYTPEQAAKIVTEWRRRYNVKRMAISGGEPTLNRKWLISYFRALKKLNPDKDARLHLDTNGTLLTPDYIDELLDSGVTDIGVEPKGVRVETFAEITGIYDKEKIHSMLSRSWDAVRYIAQNYKDKVFLGVGLPYNKEFMRMEEVHEFGKRVVELDRKIQLCVLDYFPTFRRRDFKRPTVKEMLEVRSTLQNLGLQNVVVQTSKGHINPDWGDN